jgi:hypothetical protein
VKWILPANATDFFPGLPDVSRYNIPNWGNIHSTVTTKHNKWLLNKANGHEVGTCVYQMVIKDIKNFIPRPSKTYQNWRVWFENKTIWQPCFFPVATVAFVRDVPAQSPIWDRCYGFSNIFAEKFGKNIGVFCSNYSYFLKKIDHNIGFGQKRQFFRRKL